MRVQVAIVMGLLAVLALGSSSGAKAAEPPQEARARLDVAEREARQRFEQDRQVCAGQFLVEACLERARERLRVDVQAIRAERLELDARRRRERAQQRQARIEAKAAQTRELAATTAAKVQRNDALAQPPVLQGNVRPVAGAATGEPMSDRVVSLETAARPVDVEPARASKHARQHERAARSAQARSRRASAAQAHRESVMLREAQRGRDKAAAAPLPLPAASR